MVRAFISYAREDQAVVRPLAEGLQRAGLDVWWDTDLRAGDAFRASIEEALQRSDVVLVVWSGRAKASRWVLDEAEVGVQRGILLPVRIDAAPLPLGFGGFNTLDFSAWGGDFNAQAWRDLLGEIERITGASAMPAARPPIRILSKVLAVAAGWGVVIGASIWALYVLGGSAGVRASMLGHPIIDSFALAFLGSLPIALWSALEVERAGFDSLALVLRRSCAWLLKGAIVALLVLVAAIAAGAVKGASPRDIAAELSRIFVVATAVTACILTLGNLLWFAIRRGLGMKAG